LFRVKPVRFELLDSIKLSLPEFRPPRFRGNPSNLPASERLFEPIFGTVGFKGLSADTEQATPKSPE
ncbi:hypothetical protein, partial [Streptosporangium sp. NPDC087985]|uniref:hypothetical protein n=1 Tax=Streptosporangium sp. NPDC087985 TaxID=3366196 RepID=UPI00380312EF